MPLRASDVASGNDVYFVSDVTPDGVMGKRHIIATDGSNIIMSEASNITFAQAKASLFYRPKQIMWYKHTIPCRQGSVKKGREFLVLFDFVIKQLYGRYP